MSDSISDRRDERKKWIDRPSFPNYIRSDSPLKQGVRGFINALEILIKPYVKTREEIEHPRVRMWFDSICDCLTKLTSDDLKRNLSIIRDFFVLLFDDDVAYRQDFFYIVDCFILYQLKDWIREINHEEWYVSDAFRVQLKAILKYLEGNKNG